MRALYVFLEGVTGPVGRLTGHDDGSTGFRYLRADLPYPLSQSLPVRDAPYGDASTRAFFDNLLFENAQRDQVMQRHGLAYGDTVGLLFHLGRDCPGAISVVPEGEAPGKVPGNLEMDYDPLDAAGLADLMRSLRDHGRVPDATADPSPLAGLQGKIALARLPDGRFGLPRPGTTAPTTHILKVSRAREMQLVFQEHRLMEIAARLLDHPVAGTEIVGDGDLQGLLIARFDRHRDGNRIHRLHQEDFCQALGLGPTLKYERNGTGDRAFTAARVGALLTACAQPGRARQAFLEGTVVNLLFGNTDNHAKNHALLYRGARPNLAPFYDIVPTLIDDTVTHQLAFRVGRATMTDTITPEDIAAFLADLGYRRMTPALRRRLGHLVEGVLALIPEMRGPQLKRIGDAMGEQARWIAPALGLDLKVPDRDLVVINRP